MSATWVKESFCSQDTAKIMRGDERAPAARGGIEVVAAFKDGESSTRTLIRNS